MRIPKWLVPEYDYGGRVLITNFYRDDSKNWNNWKAGVWKQDIINKWESAIRNETFKGPYGIKTVRAINDILKDNVELKDKKVLIIGSETPWIEIITLINGAKEVTSVDYSERTCEDPRIKLMTTY